MFLLGTQKINPQGHLEIGGCDAVELAAQFGTPLYVMDEAHIRGTIARYRAAFSSQVSDFSIIYASKAFPTMAMAALAAAEGLWLDAASAGEMHTALCAGFPAERMIFHGNYKSAEELEMALDAGLGRIVVDNLTELALLNRLAEVRGQCQPVWLRLTPAVDPHTHHYIQTGRVDTKFGMNFSGGGAARGVEAALAAPHLELKGLACHIGSQILEAEFFQMGARQMVEFMAQMKQQQNFTPAEIDLGGGLGVRYLPTDAAPPIEEYVTGLVRTVREECARYDLPVPHLAVEPGRSLVGEAGVTLYRVGPIKHIPGVRTYVAVDGGMSDNPRPALYQARYTVVNASRVTATECETVTLAGKHCETDTLVENISLATPQVGDILAVQTTGAYNYSMASNYNRFRRPAVVLVNAGQADIIVERETLDDVIAQDRLPARLRG